MPLSAERPGRVTLGLCRLLGTAFLAVGAACLAEDRAVGEAGVDASRADAAAEDAALSIVDCLEGAAFVDCPGPERPALYCSEDACKWISTGGPVPPYLAPARLDDCSCELPGCDFELLFFRRERGDAPWTREQDLVLDVAFDSALEVDATSFSCGERCGHVCTSGDNPCTASLPGVIDRSFPGTYVVRMGNLGGMHGWMLELEVDLAVSPPRARACRLPFTDFGGCEPGRERACASSGTVVLAARPSPRDSYVAGRFDVTFEPGETVAGQFIGHAR